MGTTRVRTGTGPGTGAPVLCRRDVRLESFLKRNTERAVYERMRVHEPCVVLSRAVNKAYMHVILSDERVYLTEFPPRTLTEAVSFERVRDIELVNDLPEFLTLKDRERCQHIRIVHSARKPHSKKPRDWLRRTMGAGLHVPAPPPRRISHCPAGAELPASRTQWGTEELQPVLKSIRSSSCPNPESLGLLRVPLFPGLPPPPHSLSTSPSTSPSTTPSTSPSQRRFGSVLSRLLRRDRVEEDEEEEEEEEEEEAELHLYAVSHTSRLYLILQSAWTSYIIRSTLLLDPLYRRRCSSSSDSPAPSISWERTLLLFSQLSSEVLEDGISLERLYLLLQELKTAAHRSPALRRLFWRSGELCVFLVQTLEDCLHGRQSLSGLYTADQLLLSSLVVQTLSVMFREMEEEAPRIHLLAAKKGSVASRLLLAVICHPELRPADSPESLMDPQLQVLLDEYLDSAPSLLFEMLLLGHETHGYAPADSHLTVGWILRVLQPHPHVLSFLDHQAQQVILVLAGTPQQSPSSPLSPAHTVLLYQRCRLLLACLQHNSLLSQHLKAHYREEFRFSVKLSCVEEKLPPHYPISVPTLRLVRWILPSILRP